MNMAEFEKKMQNHADRVKGVMAAPFDIERIEREGLNMSKRKFNIKKTALIAAAAVLVLTTAAFAGSSLIASWSGGSSSIPDYKSLPTAEQCIEDIGYAPILIDTFENGYKFEDGNIVSNDLTDENGFSVEKFKSVSFNYEKDNDEVVFSQEKYNSEMESYGEVIASIDGVDIYYHSYKNKCVAGDYKMTEEDKEKQASGELVFSFGVEKDEIDTVQSVFWEKDGIHYSLMQINGLLSADELVKMAEEAIAE